jgi:tetratricopeptide (TPR) repeat protein
MTTAGQTATRFETATFDELARDMARPGRQRMHVRRHFDIGAFGSNAYRADAGTDVITDHDELGAASGGHEELYVVVAGHATFTLDGEDLDAPAGTLVFVRDTAVRRKAVARAAGTTVLVVGAKPGEAFTPSAWESMSEMWAPYEAGDYETALGVVQAALQKHPGNPVLFYNLACCDSLLGHKDEALAALREAARDDRLREQAPKDSDFDAIRDDPRFAELVPEGD